MVEVFNLEGMPVYKYRSAKEESFRISDLEGKGVWTAHALYRIGRRDQYFNAAVCGSEGGGGAECKKQIPEWIKSADYGCRL